MKIVTDPKTNGTVFSCASMAKEKAFVDMDLGRLFAVLTRDLAPRGYKDFGIDDYDPDTWLGVFSRRTAGGGDHRAKVSHPDGFNWST